MNCLATLDFNLVLNTKNVSRCKRVPASHLKRWKSQLSVVVGPRIEPAAEPVGDSLNHEMHSLFPCFKSLFHCVGNSPVNG